MMTSAYKSNKNIITYNIPDIQQINVKVHCDKQDGRTPIIHEMSTV